MRALAYEIGEREQKASYQLAEVFALNVVFRIISCSKALWQDSAQ